MATLAFVLFWVILGLGLLLIALRGGGGGAARRPGRSTRRLTWIGFAICVAVLGVAIPAAVIAAVESRDDIPEANVSNLTPAEKEGRELFGQRCRNCHTLEAANAIAKVGPNLDQLRPPKALVLDAIRNGRARGNGQMAADLVTGTEAEDVADFVAKAVGSAQQPGG